MKLLDLLRKLGILRFGGQAATYRDARERPAELQMDDVFDARKDLVRGAETSTAPGRTCPRCGKPASSDARSCPACGASLES